MVVKINNIFQIFLIIFIVNSNTFAFNYAPKSTEFITRFFYKFVPSSSAYHTDQRSYKRHTPEICDDNKLMLTLAMLLINSPDRIITLISAGNLSDYCTKIKSSLSTVDGMLESCTPLEKANNLYIRLFNGTRSLYNMSCTCDGEFRKKYDEYQICYNQLHEELMECEGPDDWYEDSKQEAVCKNYEIVLTCNYVKISELCGLEAAHLMHLVAKDVFNAVLGENINCHMDVEPIGLAESFTVASKRLFLYNHYSWFFILFPVFITYVLSS